jgi:deoxyribose-phosphate aldolase
MNTNNIASMIDHTILKAETTAEMVKKICKEARDYGFASVCVNSSFVPLASVELKDSSVKVCTVIAFPLGAASSESKAAETKIAKEQGAQEFDMVINLGRLLQGDNEYVLRDIKSVVDAAAGLTVKVILETCYLNKEQIVQACQLAEKAGAHFVKTSTGFGTGGATEEDVSLMVKTVPQMQVKASGGI